MIDFQRPLEAAVRLFGTAATLAAAILLSARPAYAAPGAHGPGGEHLDQPGAMAVSSSRPRVEARSDLFELVASLQGGELTVLVDRYETNEPVLGAVLEVEGAGLKALARFREDRGDYAVADPAFIEAIASPGEHAMVFTLMAGNDADLLDGTLVVLAHGERGRPSPGGFGTTVQAYFVPAGAAIAAAAAIAVLLHNRRRRASVAPRPQGEIR